MCAYSIIHLFKDFIYGLNKYFHVTSEEGSELSYLNLHTIQYPYDIIIDHTYHIRDIWNL